MSEDKKLEALMRDNKMRAAIERQASKPPPLPDIPAELEAADMRPWHPVERRMGMFKREEKGIYTDEGTPGLFYFKATHWRYIK